MGGPNPLEHVISTWPIGLPSPLEQPGYGFEVGTSMAAPHVSGAAALIWSTNPTLTRDEVEVLLVETADDLGPPGRDDRFGYGRLNVQRALERAGSLPGARPANIRLIVDTPLADMVVGTTMVVNGWAVDGLAERGTGIDLVEAFLDGPPGAGSPARPPAVWPHAAGRGAAARPARLRECRVQLVAGRAERRSHALGARPQRAVGGLGHAADPLLRDAAVGSRSRCRAPSWGTPATSRRPAAPIPRHN